MTKTKLDMITEELISSNLISEVTPEQSEKLQGGNATVFDGTAGENLLQVYTVGTHDLDIDGHNQKISSVYITEGERWEFYDLKNYDKENGSWIPLEGGLHSFYGTSLNNDISSLRFVGFV